MKGTRRLPRWSAIINTIHRNGTLDAVVVSRDDIVLAVAQRDEQHHRYRTISSCQSAWQRRSYRTAEAGVDFHSGRHGTDRTSIGREEQAFKQDSTASSVYSSLRGVIGGGKSAMRAASLSAIHQDAGSRNSAVIEVRSQSVSIS